MFLITTADKRFWKTEDKILFLGEWCKLFSEKAIWEKLSYEVLTYHWEDRKKRYQDYLYLNDLYERILADLVEKMNQIHNVRHTLRYWRIVIGPWLFYFIQVLYDRYQSILKAIESGKVTNTLIGSYGDDEWLSRDYPQFLTWAISDEYNHYLYDRIIAHTNRLPFMVLSPDSDTSNSLKNTRGNAKRAINFKKLLRYFVKLYEKFIPDRFNRIVLAYSYLNIWDLVQLQISLGQLPYLFLPDTTIPESNIDWNLRENLDCGLSLNSEFEKLLVQMIKEQIPCLYVEGYDAMSEISLRLYPKNPKAIINGNAYYANEGFKFWAAHNVDRGVKFAVLQYGGFVGTDLYSMIEEHEIRIADRYYSWGWKSDEYCNIKSLPAVKLNSVKCKTRLKKDGRILLVLLNVPRYSHLINADSVDPSGALAYINDQYRFVRALSKKNQELLLVRLYMHDYGWNQEERWAFEFPNIEHYRGNKTMLTQLNESRLFIGTYNSTTYLEAFAADFPTVLFWNPHHWELRPSAKEYFDDLHRAGILYDTPESAARKVNEISNDPLSWWRQSEIQAAKDRFCYRFARTSDYWLKECKEELKGLAGI